MVAHQHSGCVSCSRCLMLAAMVWWMLAAMVWWPGDLNGGGAVAQLRSACVPQCFRSGQAWSFWLKALGEGVHGVIDVLGYVTLLTQGPLVRVAWH